MRGFGAAVAWVLIFQLMGAGIGVATSGGDSPWYQALAKPSFNPPNWVFPAVWTTLYVLIAIAGWRLWRDRRSPGGSIRFGLFAAQMVMNWAWSPIFFNAHLIGVALVWLWAINALVASLIVLSWKPDRLTAVLLLPYLAWGLFAGALNWSIWTLNP